MPDLVRKPEVDPERIDEGDNLHLGTWVWVYNHKPENGSDEIEGWLGCIVHVGSNYVKVEEPHTSRNSYHSERIHKDDISELLKIEPDPDSVIGKYIKEYKGEVQSLLGEAKRLVESLGLSTHMLPGGEDVSSRALVLVSETPDIKSHKNALVKAKDKTLPDIFKKIKENNSELVRWMSAKALPMMAMAGQTRHAVDDIEDRVFTIELYAGLLEEIELVRKGKPAGLDDKLHVMQRRCYMDEECLLGYKTGGIDITNLGQFDKWLSKKTNLERVLPFPRCMVAFQVRRYVKEREWDGTFGGVFIKVQLDQQDKLTFLYIRNGKRLYRLNTELTFGSKIFPDRDQYVLSENMWAKMFANKVEELVPDREYQDTLKTLKKRERERKQKEKKWKKKNPGRDGFHNPYMNYGVDFDKDVLRGYEPYDPTSVYYDDIHRKVERQIKQYNRIAVIVQGLLDRSKVLHPHPPAKLWTLEGFAAAVELVYDADRVLYAGETPDFGAYREKCNESMKQGSVTVGQEEYWEKKEAVKYMNGPCAPTNYIVKRHQPSGNPGPGFLARIDRWASRVRKATYRWERERQTYQWYYRQRTGPIQTGVVVPASQLFNVDAYQPGDYKQFFEDPRTRAGYLKWSEMLLAAEEYHAGNLKVDQEK
ncbi:MAG TPA: hypothetical protein ENI27_06815 [bacterium]|nr:hypothetical protein [bacterium]